MVAIVSLQEGWLLQGKLAKLQSSQTTKAFPKPKVAPVFGFCPLRSGQFSTKPNGTLLQIRTTASYKGAESGLSEIKYCLTLRFHIWGSSKSIFPL